MTHYIYNERFSAEIQLNEVQLKQLKTFLNMIWEKFLSSASSGYLSEHIEQSVQNFTEFIL